jgi:outer membrane protein assembly factor BamB
MLVLATGIEPQATKKLRSPRGGIDWPSFRGIQASGVADGFSTPVRWDATSGIVWKTPIPGVGHSSPVIWGDNVCLSSVTGELRVRELPSRQPSHAEDEEAARAYRANALLPENTELAWRVFCVDKRSGKVRWTRVAYTGKPSIGRHTTSTHANPSLATDGVHLVAFFGSEGLYTYRMTDGHLLWQKKFGLLEAGYYKSGTQWGFSSSPVIDGEHVIVLSDVQQGSFIAAYALKDGREVWRTPRGDVPTFGTPTVVGNGQLSQVVVNGWRESAGYDIATGKRRWRIDGRALMGDLPIATPVAYRDLIFLTSSHNATTPILAVKADAVGDITWTDESVPTPSHIAWSVLRAGAYVVTPIVYGDYLYVLRDHGVLAAYRAASGTRVYQRRLEVPGRYVASPVAADGKLYITGPDGDVMVVKAGETYEVLSINALGEPVSATPAISEGRLYFRTRSHLIAIGGHDACVQLRDPAPRL